MSRMIQMQMLDMTTKKIHRVADRTWDMGGSILEITLNQKYCNPFTRMFWIKYFHFTSAIKGRVFKIYNHETKFEEYVTLESIDCGDSTGRSNGYAHRLIFRKLDNFEVFKHVGKKR